MKKNISIKIKLIIEKNKIINSIIKGIYQKTFGKYNRYIIKRRFIKNSSHVINVVNEVFYEIKCPYWIDFGTLLGAVRDRAFIKHDFDIDIGMYLSDYSSEHQKIFEKHGFRKTRTYLIDDGIYGREESYELLGVSVDIFFYTKISESQAYCHVFKALDGKSDDTTILKLGGLIPKEFTLSINKLGKINFIGKDYPIPEPHINHLIDIYGPDYMIENPKWVTVNTENFNIKTLEDKIGVRS